MQTYGHASFYMIYSFRNAQERPSDLLYFFGAAAATVFALQAWLLFGSAVERSGAVM
jgi:hypothetical protein